MAHKTKDEDHHVKWFHVESGQRLYRRIHKLEILTAMGIRHVVRGSDLPDTIVTYAGPGYKGAHIAEIFLRPNSLKLPVATGSALSDIGKSLDLPWPNSRDAIQWIIGGVFVMMLNFFASAGVC